MRRARLTAARPTTRALSSRADDLNVRRENRRDQTERSCVYVCPWCRSVVCLSAQSAWLPTPMQRATPMLRGVASPAAAFADAGL